MGVSIDEGGPALMAGPPPRLCLNEVAVRVWRRTLADGRSLMPGA